MACCRKTFPNQQTNPNKSKIAFMRELWSQLFAGKSLKNGDVFDCIVGGQPHGTSFKAKPGKRRYEAVYQNGDYILRGKEIIIPKELIVSTKPKPPF